MCDTNESSQIECQTKTDETNVCERATTKHINAMQFCVWSVPVYIALFGCVTQMCSHCVLSKA